MTTTMKNTRFLAPAALALAMALPCAPAWALVFQGASGAGGSNADDYSEAGLLSFDIDFTDTAPVTLTYLVQADDLLAPVDFNAIARNFTGLGQNWLSFTLDGGTSFAGVGTVTRYFGGAATVSTAGGQALLAFTPAEFLDVQIGDPLGTTPGAHDWSVRLAPGLRAGDSFSITAAIPEPASAALVLCGLALVAWRTAKARRAQG